MIELVFINLDFRKSIYNQMGIRRANLALIGFDNALTKLAMSPRHFDCVIEKRRGKLRQKKFCNEILDV